mmetsp:Transcript_11374/g.25912  ORF Transcript_11374/g.25912 Transcript_11374/m.25912 type:complete len:353 (+) Transcript_11374:1826-2884(+)
MSALRRRGRSRSRSSSRRKSSSSIPGGDPAAHLVGPEGLVGEDFASLVRPCCLPGAETEEETVHELHDVHARRLLPLLDLRAGTRRLVEREARVLPSDVGVEERVDETEEGLLAEVEVEGRNVLPAILPEEEGDRLEGRAAGGGRHGGELLEEGEDAAPVFSLPDVVGVGAEEGEEADGDAIGQGLEDGGGEGGDTPDSLHQVRVDGVHGGEAEAEAELVDDDALAGEAGVLNALQQLLEVDVERLPDHEDALLVGERCVCEELEEQDRCLQRAGGIVGIATGVEADEAGGGDDEGGAEAGKGVVGEELGVHEQLLELQARDPGRQLLVAGHVEAGGHGVLLGFHHRRAAAP